MKKICIIVCLCLSLCSCKSSNDQNREKVLQKQKVSVSYGIAAYASNGNITLARNKLSSYRIDVISNYIFGLSFVTDGEATTLQKIDVELSGDMYTLEDVSISREAETIYLERGTLTYTLEVEKKKYTLYSLKGRGESFKSVYNRLLIDGVKQSGIARGKIYPVDDLLVKVIKEGQIEVAGSFIILPGNK